MLRVAIGIIALLLSQAALAVTMAIYMKSLESDSLGDLNTYNYGVNEAVMAMNQTFRREFGKQLFCLPKDRELNRDIVHEATMFAFRKHPDRKRALEIPPAFFAVVGLQAMYPCKSSP